MTKKEVEEYIFDYDHITKMELEIIKKYPLLFPHFPVTAKRAMSAKP